MPSRVVEVELRIGQQSDAKRPLDWWQLERCCLPQKPPRMEHPCNASCPRAGDGEYERLAARPAYGQALDRIPEFDHGLARTVLQLVALRVELRDLLQLHRACGDLLAEQPDWFEQIRGLPDQALGGVRIQR